MVSTWAECLALVKSVKGAQYKSFEAITEAEEYLSEDKEIIKKGIDSYPIDCIHVYVDGSYNLQSRKVFLCHSCRRDDVIEYMENGEAEDNSQKQAKTNSWRAYGSSKGSRICKNPWEKRKTSNIS